MLLTMSNMVDRSANIESTAIVRVGALSGTHSTSLCMRPRRQAKGTGKDLAVFTSADELADALDSADVFVISDLFAEVVKVWISSFGVTTLPVVLVETMDCAVNGVCEDPERVDMLSELLNACLPFRNFLSIPGISFVKYCTIC